MSWGSVLRCVTPVALVVLYSLCTHYVVNAGPGDGPGQWIAFVPTAGVALFFALQTRRPLLWVLLWVGTLVTLVMLWTPYASQFAWAAFLDHAVSYVALAWMFGRTLRRSAIPWCTRIALIGVQTLSPKLVNYTRGVTLAWTAFFALMAITSAGLFAYAPLTAWSTFANLLSLPLVAAMFIVEYVCRIFCVPADERTSLLDTFSSLMQSTARTSKPTSGDV